EQRPGAGDREVLRDVDLLAAAVVPTARVALGVLVGEHGALRLQDGARDEVLGRDHLEGVALARELAVEDGRDLGVELGERGVEDVVGWLGAHGVSSAGSGSSSSVVTSRLAGYAPPVG